mmetsp:Transcript_5701/g.9506  ORF Transcript_5701/g.9506 Transcript_5701/m.9506 type:complete len:84 (-) Transcript_5701:447-698(-)
MERQQVLSLRDLKFDSHVAKSVFYPPFFEVDRAVILHRRWSSHANLEREITLAATKSEAAIKLDWDPSDCTEFLVEERHKKGP